MTVPVLNVMNQADYRIIGWHGIEIALPPCWEPRFPGKRYVVFEKDFKPQLQIRWESGESAQENHLVSQLEKSSSHIEVIKGKNVPLEWSFLKKEFEIILLAAPKDRNMITKGILACRRTDYIFFFQITEENPGASDEAKAVLATLTCRNGELTLWQFQDFSFKTPKNYTLTNYSFEAGLTRLSFSQSGLICHICRLAPADRRLEQQPLDEILKTLTGEKDFSISSAPCSCTIRRNPPAWKQILYRLSRRKPFHLERQNLLLASVQLSRRPIYPDPPGYFNTSHETIQEKTTS